MNIFKLKTISEVLDSANNAGLKKTLGVFHLLLLGLGAIIGTGIFGITGIAAVSISGPAVVLAYIVAGATAIFIALAYTEIAAMIPTSGGAYSYTFVAFGEIVAWLVSWMLILYFITGCSTVASCWSGYMVAMLESGGITLPIAITKAPSFGGIINLPASIISLLVTAILVRGTKESTIINAILVLIKFIAIGLFIFVSAPHFDTIHWFEHNNPFNSDLFMSSSFLPYGISGVISGAAFVFLAYNGFDAIAAAAEECKNPRRDLTIGILGSLIICIILYVIVASLLVGIIPYHMIDIDSPIPSALSYNGHTYVSSLIGGGVVVGMISVIMAQLFALSRVVLVTARDGLMPAFLTKIHPKFSTPHVSIIIFGIIIAITSGLVPVEIINTLSSVGALFSFIVVCFAVIVLRHRYPDVARPFKCPAVYFVSGCGILLCLTLLTSALQKVGLSAAIWVFLGLALYFIYYKVRTKQA